MLHFAILHGRIMISSCLSFGSSPAILCSPGGNFSRSINISNNWSVIGLISALTNICLSVVCFRVINLGGRTVCEIDRYRCSITVFNCSKWGGGSI